jgi:hypothetical protein
MANTIHFNTGRKYTQHGQRITATLHSDGQVTFMDHDRMIDGEFMLGYGEVFDQRTVMNAYDHSQHGDSKRSRADGMMRGGCNTKYEGK